MESNDYEYIKAQFQLTYGHYLYTYTLSDDSFLIINQSGQTHYGMKYLLLN